MTDRIDALKKLKACVETDSGEYSFKDLRTAGFHNHSRLFIEAKANGSIDAARSLVKALLPGWGYRVCECWLSDDAAVFPDFNCPEHGERLKREINPDVDWFDLTDVDQRPAGNPVRALLLSILIALIAIEEQSQ